MIQHTDTLPFYPPLPLSPNSIWLLLPRPQDRYWLNQSISGRSTTSFLCEEDASSSVFSSDLVLVPLEQGWKVFSASEGGQASQDLMQIVSHVLDPKNLVNYRSLLALQLTRQLRRKDDTDGGADLLSFLRSLSEATPYDAAQLMYELSDFLLNALEDSIAPVLRSVLLRMHAAASLQLSVETKENNGEFLDKGINSLGRSVQFYKSLSAWGHSSRARNLYDQLLSSWNTDHYKQLALPGFEQTQTPVRVSEPRFSVANIPALCFANPSVRRNDRSERMRSWHCIGVCDLNEKQLLSRIAHLKGDSTDVSASITRISQTQASIRVALNDNIRMRLAGSATYDHLHCAPITPLPEHVGLSMPITSSLPRRLYKKGEEMEWQFSADSTLLDKQNIPVQFHLFQDDGHLETILQRVARGID